MAQLTSISLYKCNVSPRNRKKQVASHRFTLMLSIDFIHVQPAGEHSAAEEADRIIRALMNNRYIFILVLIRRLFLQVTWAAFIC